MRIEILSEAENDLLAGANFYKRRGAGLGEYFLDSLYSDIDSLLLRRNPPGDVRISSSVIAAISLCDLLSV